MTGTLAQIIALTAYGNDYLKNGKLTSDFDSINSTFQFCNKVDFREFKKMFFFFKPSEKIIANVPTDWFKYLKANGCMYLRLYFEYSKNQSMAKDHKLAGLIGGGGTWLIEAIYENYSNYWANKWEVTNQKAVDNKIWSVNYGMVLKKEQSINLQVDNLNVKDKLRLSLTEIADFANKKNLKDWGEIFTNAKKALDSSSPEDDYYHRDLIPLDNYSLTSKQNLFAAGSAWVFGGMGSWNDLGFDSNIDNELYDSLSEQLYANINEAIISAINSY